MGGLHFPRSPKSSVCPRLRPTELHYRLISSALHALPDCHSRFDYRILPADISRKQCNAIVFKRIKRFSLAATKMKKIRNEMNSFVRISLQGCMVWVFYFFFLFSLANKKHLVSPPPVIIPSSHAILSSVHPSSHLPRSLSLLFHT